MASSKIFDVAIAGAGPGGTSAAIELGLARARVLLIEEKKFPRAKLCGEFISPECLTHFARLGVLDQMISAGGASLSETVFYSRRGHSVAVPSEWFKSGASALGLSRSEMDQKLMERAKSVGVVVLEGAHASGLISERGQIRGIRVKAGEVVSDYLALVTIDATGRTRALARHVDQGDTARTRTRPTLIAFKAHLENAHVAPGACEIYVYPGGYGGLSGVERGLSNLCFIVSAKDVRRYGSEPAHVMHEIVMKNSRAAYTLAQAHASTPWLSVSLERFGRSGPAPANGLLTIGDAAAFIDPFTGSGMLMALESGQLAAEVVSRHLPSLGGASGLVSLARDYKSEYFKRFNSRLRTSSILRRAAFLPHLAEVYILFFGTSSRLRRKFARATRPSDSSEAGASTG